MKFRCFSENSSSLADKVISLLQYFHFPLKTQKHIENTQSYLRHLSPLMVMQVILLPLFCSIIITNVAVVLSDSCSELFFFRCPSVLIGMGGIQSRLIEYSSKSRLKVVYQMRGVWLGECSICILLYDGVFQKLTRRISNLCLRESKGNSHLWGEFWCHIRQWRQCH